MTKLAEQTQYNLQFRPEHEPQLTLETRKALKEHRPGTWLSYQSLQCQQNERKRKSFIVHLLLSLVKQGRKVAIVSRAVHDLELELENACSCIELTENAASQALYRLGHYDVCCVQPGSAGLLAGMSNDVLFIDGQPKAFEGVYPQFGANFTIVFVKEYQGNEAFIASQLVGLDQCDTELLGYLELGYQAFLVRYENEVYRSVSFGCFESNKDYSDHIGDIRT